MNKFYITGGGKFEYSAPSISLLEVTIEKGFAESLDFGEEGFPGTNPGSGSDFGDF